MGYLYCIVAFFLFAGALCLVQAGENDCQLENGTILRDGQRTNDKCTYRSCRSGKLQYNVVACGSPNCWDSALVPGQCCRNCPNGSNCKLFDGEILAAGKSKDMGNGQVCSCPSSFSGMYLATCIPPYIPRVEY